MATISLIPITAFDSQYEQVFEFLYQGNQSVKNQLTIYNNTDNSKIYDETETTFRLSHTLPANILLNGGIYNYQITAYDIYENATTSSKGLFRCLTTPIWYFSNVSEQQVIRNSNYVFNLEYYQEQGDLINEYKVILYNSEMREIWNSGTKLSPVTSVEIGGLADNSTYYLRAVGKTVSGFNLDTDFIHFSVMYNAFALNQVLLLENKEKEGTVKITSRIVIIHGRPIPDPPTYIDDEIIDLREPGSSVIFDEGFSVDGDFIIEFIGFGFAQNQSLLYASDGWSGTNLYWRKGMFTNSDGTQSIHTFAEIRVSPAPYYIVFSNHIDEDINDTDMVHVWIRRLNGLYECKMSKV